MKKRNLWAIFAAVMIPERVLGCGTSVGDCHYADENDTATTKTSRSGHWITG